MKKTEIEARWDEIRPELLKSWQAWNQLHHLPTDPAGASDIWEANERELISTEPRLYRDWQNGETPAQALGKARTELHDSVSGFMKRFGYLTTGQALAAVLGWDIDPRKVKKIRVKKS